MQKPMLKTNFRLGRVALTCWFS